MSVFSETLCEKYVQHLFQSFTRLLNGWIARISASEFSCSKPKSILQSCHSRNNLRCQSLGADHFIEINFTRP